MRWTSVFHAVIVTAAGIAIVINVTASYTVEDYTNWFGLFGRINISWSIGYMLHDLVWMMIFRQKVEATIPSYLHHIVAIAAFYLCLYFHVLLYYANFRIITEFSTPFVNIRWMLSVTNRKDTKLYFYNGITMTATFFIFRICLIPPLWVSVCYVMQTTSYQTSVNIFEHVGWLSFSVFMDLLNIVWMYKMMKGVLTFLNPSASQRLRDDEVVGLEEARSGDELITSVTSD